MAAIGRMHLPRAGAVSGTERFRTTAWTAEDIFCASRGSKTELGMTLVEALPRAHPQMVGAEAWTVVSVASAIAKLEAQNIFTYAIQIVYDRISVGLAASVPTASRQCHRSVPK